MQGRYKIIGNVALVRLDINKTVIEKTIQDIISKNSKLIAVLGYKGIHGEYRTPVVELLWGNLPPEIMHTEYGVHYYLDPSKLMFSLGNLYERLKTASMVRSWEIVVDMFAGLGQFTIPIAVHSRPKIIHAIEINPVAFNFLVKNIKINGVENIVATYLSDCREITSKIEKSADRVIMGYLHDTIEFLPHALNCIGKSGGIIHLHQLIKKDEKEELIQRIINLNLTHGFTTHILKSRVVKTYSANKIHLVVDFYVISQVK